MHLRIGKRRCGCSRRQRVPAGYHGDHWKLCAVNENILYLKRPMKCENCGYYKPSSYHAFDSKCEKIGLLHNHNGCEKFKPKD